MPDKRQHRGRHPGDTEAFAPEAWSRLRDAVRDLSWLLSHGYADTSALKLVGDRYNLRERQRTAVMRSACADNALASRLERQAHAMTLANQTLLVDGYNVLTTIEAAMAGGVVLAARDGCYRDMASMHGTFRTVRETIPALTMLGTLLSQLGLGQARWYLDRPVSNSGRLKTKLLAVAAEYGWDWEVELVANPDPILSEATAIVATADSVILDRCGPWFGLAREVIDRMLPDAWIVTMCHIYGANNRPANHI